VEMERVLKTEIVAELKTLREGEPRPALPQAG